MKDENGLRPEKLIKNDRLLTTEMESFKARLDAKMALEIALLNTELIDVLARNVDSDSRELAIKELMAKRLITMRSVADQLRTDYLTRLSERSQHVVNFQLLQPDLEKQIQEIATRRLAKVKKTLIYDDTEAVIAPSVTLEVSPTAVVSSSASATVGGGSVISPMEVDPSRVTGAETTGIDITMTVEAGVEGGVK